MGISFTGQRSTTMIALKLAICFLAVPALSLPSPAGGVVEGLEVMVGIITMRSLILSTSSMECMMTSITQTLVKKGLEMKLVILRESIMYTFLMEGSSMSSTMLMATMVVLSWRSNMMEKHIILNT